MTSIPTSETLTIEFKSDPPAGLPDKTVVESVVGMTNAQGGTLYAEEIAKYDAAHQG